MGTSCLPFIGGDTMATADSDEDNVAASSFTSFSEEFLDKVCVICHKEIKDTSTEKVALTEKGSNTINSVSKQLQDTVHAQVGDLVHRSCRSSYTNRKTIEAKVKEAKGVSSPRKRRYSRSSESTPQTRCLFCDKGEKRVGKGSGTLIPVRTLQFQQTVLQKCESRADPWAQKMKAKIEFVQDCVASDSMYHNICYTSFRSGYQIPRIFMDKEPQKKKVCPGRPKDKIRLDAFEHVTQYLESLDAVQITVKELVEVMENFLKNSECQAYSPPYLKSKLIDWYGDSIVFSQSNNQADIISLKRTAGSILRDFYKERRNADPEAEKLRLIKAAARLIKNDIASIAAVTDAFPDTDSIKDHVNFVPESLREFLKEVTKKKNVTLKISAIGQAVIQCSRPNTVIAPLQIGLAVQMHRSFASRFLVDTLHHLGFCSSYKEVRKFELNAAQTYGIDLPLTTDSNSIQFIADNVDHNSATLDGRNTFHGMGIIAAVTPGVKTARRIPRREVNLTDITAIGQIGIHFYRSDWKGLSAMTFKTLPGISSDDDTANLDLLWKISWPLKSGYPAWNGMMQMVQDGEHPKKSSFIFLPMIDLSSTDLSCIYSTLKFISSQAYKSKVAPIVTFDQPLYFKALAIISNEKTDNDLKMLSCVLVLFIFRVLDGGIWSSGDPGDSLCTKCSCSHSDW